MQKLTFNHIEIIFDVGNLCLIEHECDEYSLQANGTDYDELDSEFRINANWGLDRIDQENLPLDKAPYSSYFNGLGSNIYILDTGINKDHFEFQGNRDVRTIFSAINSEPIEGDFNGHGTHVASSSAGLTVGVAPGANIYAVKVLSGGGGGSTTGVIKGIAQAVKHSRGEPSVLSMSLGGGRSTAMNAAVQAAAREKNIVVVVAAGNENSHCNGVSPASAGGNGKSTNGYSTITVGSSTIDDTKSSFSNYGECVDIWAPGQSIYGAWKGGNDRYKTISGTSMATPHVSGSAALYLDKFMGDKELAIKELFLDTRHGIIEGIKHRRTPNEFIQIPKQGNISRPPTVPPTFRPTSPQPLVWVKGMDNSVDFSMSSFGPDIGEFQFIDNHMVLSEDDGCTFKKRPNWKNNVIVIPRGNCLFFDKVKHAQRAGAKGVLISLVDPRARLFSPGYYGSGTVKIPSAMVRYEVFKYMSTIDDDMIRGAFGTPGPNWKPDDGEEEEEEEEEENFEECMNRCNGLRRRRYRRRCRRRCRKTNGLFIPDE